MHKEPRHTRTVRKISTYQDPPCTVERISQLAGYYEETKMGDPYPLEGKAMPYQGSSICSLKSVQLLAYSTRKKTVVSSFGITDDIASDSLSVDLCLP